MATPRPARPPRASARLRLRTPEPLASPRRHWWPRPFSSDVARVRPKAHESDAVVTARLSRTVTIATALITAVVGIAGTVTTAVLSYETGSRQIATEKERSVEEFLRNQREAAYTAYTDQEIATYKALQAVLAQFPPGGPNRNRSVFEAKEADFANQYAKLADASEHLRLVASQPVIDAALHLFARYNGCLQRVVDGKKYLLEDKPVDEAYEKLRLSDADGNEFDSLADAFISAASSELHSTGLQR